MGVWQQPGTGSVSSNFVRIAAAHRRVLAQMTCYVLTAIAADQILFELTDTHDHLEACFTESGDDFIALLFVERLDVTGQSV